jgi:hypothetical protein
MPELLERSKSVSQMALTLFSRYFEMAAEADYLTVFTTQASERQQLDSEAEKMGQSIGNKNGQVYRLFDEHTAGLSTNVVRVRDPKETDQIGCADFVVADYLRIKERAINLPGFTEVNKTTDGISYSIIELADPALRVSIFLPSIRMMGNVLDR